MRYRNDKPANAKKTAISVWHSILNPIEKELLIKSTEHLRMTFPDKAI